MSIQRLAPHQISTSPSLDAARESVWSALALSGLSDVLIDRELLALWGARFSAIGR